jgi:hypothetical protein
MSVLIQQSLVDEQVANIYARAPFPQRGMDPQVTTVCQIYQLGERGLRLWLPLMV